MLTIYGRKQRFCDGVSRRQFLKIGGFALGSLGGLSLTDVLRAEAATGRRNPHKAVINIFLAGGPPHQDLWDLKPDAPSDIRGEFKPIGTNVPGVQICEVFPRLARMMDRVAIIRSIVGSAGDHDGFQCTSGWQRRALSNEGGYPSIGSVLWKLQGQVERAVPPFIGLSGPTSHMEWSESGSPGFLGSAYAPFRPFAVANNQEERPRRRGNRAAKGPGMESIRLHGMTLERLQDRERLLKVLGQARRDLDEDPDVRAMDASFQSAFDLLTSSKLADALDLSKEDPKVVARYGDGKPYQYQYDGAPTVNDHLLIARRLVEAGCRTVTLSYGRWDSHSKNFDLVRDHGAKLDQCLSALIEDLEHRGMLDDVTVVVWGEFGRTPLVNKDAGRDHWPQVNAALVAGGGMKLGQVIGSTDRQGAYADERPVHIQEVFATIYHNLGIDTESVTLEDHTGRPQYLLDHRKPMPELVG